MAQAQGDEQSQGGGEPQGDQGSPARQDYRVWQRLAPLGLLLVGAGTAVAADASARRASGSATATWVAEGTGGLVLLNGGLSLFGEAVKRRALYDVVQRQHATAAPAAPAP